MARFQIIDFREYLHYGEHRTHLPLAKSFVNELPQSSVQVFDLRNLGAMQEVQLSAFREQVLQGAVQPQVLAAERTRPILQDVQVVASAQVWQLLSQGWHFFVVASGKVPVGQAVEQSCSLVRKRLGLHSWHWLALGPEHFAHEAWQGLQREVAASP